MDIHSPKTQLKILGPKLDIKNCVCILRTRVWLENIFRTAKINHTKFAKVLAKDGEQTGIIRKWLQGKHCVKDSKVLEVDKVYTGSADIYFDPIFRLLDPRPLTSAKLNELSSIYITEHHGLKVWQFPTPKQKENLGFPFYPTYINDSETLLERGDVYGFFALLYRFRVAELENDYLQLLSSFVDIYQAIPGLCRTIEFKNHLNSILFCVQQLKLKHPSLILSIQPRYGIIREQVRSKYHITRRALRPRDPVTQRFIELEKPYKLSGFT